jgi:hypothetical protein
MVDVANDTVSVVHGSERLCDVRGGANKEAPVRTRKILQTALWPIKVMNVLLVVYPWY